MDKLKKPFGAFLAVALVFTGAAFSGNPLLLSKVSAASATIGADPGNPAFTSDTTHAITVNSVNIPIKAEVVDGNTYDIVKFTMSTGTATIQVTCPGGVAGFTLWPKTLNIPVTQNGNTLSFTIDQPRNLMLEISGLPKMLIFATPIETNVPSPTDPDVIYYAAGIHDAGVIYLTSGKTLYLAPGALVRGRVEGIGVIM